MNYHRLKPVVSGPPKLNSFDEAIGPSSYRLEAIVVDSGPGSVWEDRESEMLKEVLIVDDDQEMLLSLTEGLKKYDDTFSVLMAGDGRVAMEKLERHPVSLVVTDLKMPRVDGFTLLAHIMEHYPDIPVIIMTGYSTPEMQRLAREGGAVGYIEKPFMIDDLARRIMTTMRKESDGGTLHGVSSGMFLQLIEMEEKTCTIRLMEKTLNRHGVLFFKEGELMDARTNGLQGLPAAYEIFSWDEVTLSIQNTCPQKEKKIKGEVQAILFEAMRLKDEAQARKEMEAEAEKQAAGTSRTPPDAGGETGRDPVFRIKERLMREMGDRCGLRRVCYDDGTWTGLTAGLERVGSCFGVGKLKVGYIDKEASNDVILLPGGRKNQVQAERDSPL